MYVFFGVGMAIYFASQGMGRMTWPLAAGLARVAVVGFGGLAWTVAWGGDIEGMFWIVAAGYVAFGGISLVGLIARRGRPQGITPPRSDGPLASRETERALEALSRLPDSEPVTQRR
jgi:hypothetical protein